MSAPRWVLLLSQAQRPTTYSKRKKEANANQDTAPLATCFANKNASACLHAQTKPKPRSHAQRLVPHAPCTTIRRSTKPGASRTRCHHQAASQQTYSSTLLDTEHRGSSTLMLCSSHACSQWAVVNGIRCANNAENPTVRGSLSHTSYPSCSRALGRHAKANLESAPCAQPDTQFRIQGPAAYPDRWTPVASTVVPSTSLPSVSQLLQDSLSLSRLSAAMPPVGAGRGCSAPY